MWWLFIVKAPNVKIKTKKKKQKKNKTKQKNKKGTCARYKYITNCIRMILSSFGFFGKRP